MPVSQYSAVQALIPDIWEGALDYIRANFAAMSVVRQFMDRQGMTPRNVSQYNPSGTAQTVAETDDITGVAYNRELLATLTPEEVGHRIDVYDQRLETDPESYISDIVRELGFVLGKKVETDVLSHVATLTGGQISDASNPFTMEHIFQARAKLEASGIGGRYIALLHPYQYLDIHSKLIGITQPAPLDIRNQAMSQYFIGSISDVDLVVAPHLPRASTANEVQTLTFGGTVSGGTFTLQVVGYDATAAIAYDANAAAITAALELIVGSGNIAVTVNGGAPDFDITFTGTLAGTDPALIVADGALLTGTSPTITIAAGTEGTASAIGAVMTRDAIAFDIRRGFRLETDRDASARLTELVASMVYASGNWRADHGVKITTDASDTA